MNPTEALALEIEGETNTIVRRKKIDQLGRLGDSNAARHLLYLYQHTSWRETRIDLIRALGRCNCDRSLEFLIALARDPADLELAAEAVLAIGQTDSPLGGEVLLNFVEDPAHPLARESVIALCNMSVFPCVDVFLRLIRATDTCGPTLTQFLIIGIGRKARGSAWPVIEAFLDPDRYPPQLFNAALIAAGKLGRSEALARLERIDTRYRFFAHQLKHASMEQIHFRLGSTFEDIFGAILAGKRPVDGFSTLRQYPHDDAWEAFTILGEESSAEASATVRLALSDGRRMQDDLNWLNQHDDVPSVLRAALYREYLYLDEARAFALLKLSPRALELCAAVHHPALVAWLMDDNNEKAHSIAGINALVAQCQMRPDLHRQAGPVLIRRIATYDHALRQRALRALGQIGHDHPATYTCLQQHLKTDDYSSVIAAWGMLDSEEAQAAIFRQIRQLPAEGADPARLKLLVSRLSALSAVRADVVLKYLNVPTLRLELLKIFSRCRADSSEVQDFIAAGLASSSHQSRMMAIAAAKLNHDARIIAMLWQIYSEDTGPYRLRALDSICHIPDGDLHLKLASSLSTAEPEVIEKTLRSLTPVPGFRYDNAVDTLQKLLKSRQDLAGNSDLVNGVHNLIENLLLRSGGESSSREDSIHAIDDQLSKLIPAFARLSAGSRAALRNAELTLGHSDLFNNLVDKSTIIIECVKCIDLQFQEKVGTRMFLGSGRLIDDMRSRIVQLGLDEDNLSQGTLVETLQCGRQFPAADFPSHKLYTLCQAFLSGKIMHEQYKVLDGLRAWGLVLLLFGRTFSHRGRVLAPVLGVADSSNPVISALAHRLNQLQELRNQAAHRGTLLSLEQATELRNSSLTCLNTTIAVIGQ